MKKILLVSFILIFWLRGLTANKYFAANGNDANTGTILSPFKTIAKLNSIWTTLNAGDSVLFRRGDVFYGTISVTKSGTLAAKIVVGAYGTGAQPITTSLVDIIGWTTTGGNIWTSAANALLPSTVKIVLSQDTLAPLGRYPNFSAANQGYLTYESSNARLQITDNSLLNTPNWTGAQVVVRVKDYITSTRTISSHVGTQVNWTTPTSDLTNGNGFFFQASLQTLDQNGEWYYNPATKRFAMYSTTMPTNVQAASLSSLVTSTTFSSITFTNINFKGANDYGFNIGVCSSCGSGGSGFSILNCTVNFTTVGIFTSMHTNSTIKNNIIIESGSDGIYMNNANNSIIRRNYVRKTAQAAGQILDGGGTGIWQKGSNIITDSNQVILSGYHGINWDGDDLLIAYNFVDSFCNVKNDGGGLYHYEAAAARENVRVINNIVLHGIGAMAGTTIPTLRQAHGIYLDILSSNTFMQGNTIAETEHGLMLNYGAKNNHARANTLFNNKNNFFVNMRAGQLSRNDTIRKNILFSYTGTQATAAYQTTNNDIGSLGLIDSNYHARPIAQTTIIRNQSTNQTLPMFRTSFPQYEVNGQISPVTVSNVNQILFLYNATFTATVTALSGTWKDVFNTSYSTSVTLQPFTSVILMSTGSLITPTITWANPSAITYPAPLSGTQLNATSGGVPGTFTYTPASGTVLNAGAAQSLSVLFTPTDQTTYSTASKTVQITVNKAAATLSYSAPSLTQTWTGLPLAPIIITSPTGLPYNITYNNVGQTPIDTGTYVLRAAVNSQNYTSPVVIGSFRINPAPATITVSNIVQQYDSTLKQVSVVTSPVGLAYTITSPKRYKGTYAVQVILNDPNHTATTVNTTLTITAGVTTLAWTPTSPLTYPTATGAGQTNATSPKNGVYTYIPPSGTVLTAGTQPLRVDFTPSDTNLAPIIGTVRNITVNKGTTSITATDTIQFADGSPKVITAIAGQPSGTVTVNYTGAHTAVGDYPFSVTYTDANWQATTVTGTLHIISNAANIFITNFANRVYTGSPIDVTVTSPYSYTLVYNPSNHTNVNNNIQVIATINDGIHTGADTVIMTIIKATPYTTWPAISAKTYPFTLSGTELNLTSPVAGVATYNPIIGTALSVATHVLTGTWTPNDLSNYNVVTVTNTVTVNKGIATIAASNFNQDYDGTAKSITASTTPANLNLLILYDGSITLPINAGSKAVNITLVDSNYNASPVNGTLVINKINAVLTFPIPAPIPVGTAITSIQLQASANIAGVFTYVPTFGNVPSTGTSFITATFHPTDSTNYNSTSIAVPLSVIGSPILNFFIRRGNILYIELP